MKEEPARDGGIRWMSWVIGSSKNVQRNDDTIPGVKFKIITLLFILIDCK